MRAELLHPVRSFKEFRDIRKAARKLFDQASEIVDDYLGIDDNSNHGTPFVRVLDGDDVRSIRLERKRSQRGKVIEVWGIEYAGSSDGSQRLLSLTKTRVFDSRGKATRDLKIFEAANELLDLTNESLFTEHWPVLFGKEKYFGSGVTTPAD